MDDLTYGEVGATQHGHLPTGYRHLSYRTCLGRDVLRLAGEAVLTWRMHEAAGVRVRASAPRAAPAVALTSELGIGPVRLSAPCRVVWTVDDDGRAGFGYGTLPGHPARGEEAFVVSRAPDGAVWFTVTSFSLPARWFTRRPARSCRYCSARTPTGSAGHSNGSAPITVKGSGSPHVPRPPDHGCIRHSPWPPAVRCPARRAR